MGNCNKKINCEFNSFFIDNIYSSLYIPNGIFNKPSK